MRIGARLCLSDLEQTTSAAPRSMAAGGTVALRFGACCPRLDAGHLLAVHDDEATLRVGGSEWRLARSVEAGGVRVPGLVSETWVVVGRRG